MRLSVALLFSTGLFAVPVVSFRGATQTQAVLAIRGYSGACTIEVSESPTYSPVIPDVNGSEYSGASTDTGRADTITQSDGTHLVTIGHMNDDRALSAATAYYWRVTCGGAATGTFSTPTVGVGASQAWPVPFNASKPWNMGYPAVSLTAPVFVTDPLTGVKLMPLTKAADRGWRPGGGSNPPLSGFFSLFQDWAGGTGWTNPANILNASTSTASTANTNPIDLYGVYASSFFGIADAPWYGISYDDVGIPIWASTSGTSNVSICIFTSPVAGCLGTPITVTPTGSFAKVASASSDPDGAWPNNFPTPFFNGWGLTAPLGPEHVNTQGTLQCTAGACVIAAPSQFSHFPSTMVAGQKVYVAGSSGSTPACTNNLCTLATYTDGAHVTFSEALTIGAGTAYKVYMWGLRVVKTAGTGTLTVGAAFKPAGSIGINQPNAASFIINPHGFTTGDGHFGYLVSTPSFASSSSQSGEGSIYFVSSDGTTRNLWNNNAWTSSTCYTYPTAGDMPSSSLSGLFGTQAVPDPNDAKTFYINANNGAGSASLFKIVYSGDLTENLNPAYTYDQQGHGVEISAAPCGHWIATNLTPASAALDIPSQIAANWSSTFDTTIYPNGGANWLFLGISPGYAWFGNFFSSQNGAAWLASADLTTGVIHRLINTFDGTGTSAYYGGMKWGGLHTTQSSFDLSTFILSTNALVNASTAAMFTGPFQTTPNAVLQADGVTWDSNTCLDWPAGSGTGCAHRGSVPAFRDCPAANQFEFMGATGTNCLTLRIPTGGVCNAFPSALEQSKFPACAWNGAFTNPIALAAGDVFSDYTSGLSGCTGGGAFLCENFRIISLSNVSGGVKVVAQRNAMYDYCSAIGTTFPGHTLAGIAPGTLPVAIDSQLAHTNGWTLAMSPGKLGSCFAAAFTLNSSTAQVIGETSLLASGHPILISGSTPGSGLSTIIGGLAARTDKTLDRDPVTGMFSLPTTSFAFSGPTFQAQGGGIGGIEQSYVQAIGGQATEFDANALNGPSGDLPESFTNSIGSVTLTHITGDIYTITPIANGLSPSKANYKTFPWIGWAGRYLLHDVSSPTAGAIDSAPWGICYAYLAGECHAGSSANTTYVNIPRAYNSGTCNTGQSWMIIPCVVFGAPGAGGVRQQRITGPDPTGQGTRLLTNLLTAPGEMYQYTHIFPSPDGSFGVASAHHTQGWTTMPWLVKLPPWQEDTQNRTQFGGITVSIPAGAQYAEVQFGYSRFIGPNAAPSLMYCTARAEGCNTSGTPYNFASETRTLTTCTSGCKITLPVSAPNLVYYRVGRSPDGTTWTYQDTNAQAIF